MARTLANGFLIGTYGLPNYPDYQAHGINNYISFHYISRAMLDEMQKAGLTGGSEATVGADNLNGGISPLNIEKTTQQVAAIRGHPALAYYSSADEPDGRDLKIGAVGTFGRALIAEYHLLASLDPARPTLVQIDNTYRPQNYQVYCETMDYSATHRYMLGGDVLGNDWQALDQLRACTQPRPYLWVTQFYPLRSQPGERVKYAGRLPVPEEMHLQMLNALAHGCKGILHYIHSGSSGGGGGAGHDIPLWDSMTAMHRQLEAAGRLAVRASPVAWTSCSNPNVRAAALLVDENNLLLVLVNEKISSRFDGFSFEPQTDVTAGVNLPPWMHLAQAGEILPGGEMGAAALQSLPGKLTVTIPSLAVGTIFWLHAGS